MHKLRLRLLETSWPIWVIYIVAYLSSGFLLQSIAPQIRIARFAYDWQVLTIYGLYLVPLSVLLRGLPWHTQYAYAIMAISPIDLVGFSIHTSIAYPDNVIDSIVGERNFTLAFVLIAAWIPYLGNVTVGAIVRRLGIIDRMLQQAQDSR